MATNIFIVDDETLWFAVAVSVVVIVGLALQRIPRGDAPPATKTGKILGGIAVALVVGFVFLIWVMVRSK